MKNVKKRILEVLKKSVDENIPVAYADSNNTIFPRASYHLIYHGKIALSNKKHKDTFLYQIDYFSTKPLDIVEDEQLLSIYKNLDEEFCITEWEEVVDIDEEKDFGIYHYYLEVRI